MRNFYSILIFCCFILKTQAQIGKLDLSFGQNGIQKTAFLTGNLLTERGKVVLSVKDGSFLIVIDAYDNQTFSSVAIIVKIKANSQIDSSFGIHGYSQFVSMTVSSAILQDEKIVVAGTLNTDFVIARFHADGFIDSSFDEDGVATIGFSGLNAVAESITLEENKILVAGSVSDFFINSDFALARLNTDGSPDSTFDGDGTVTTDFKSSTDFGKSVVIQNNKIVVIGHSSDPFSAAADFAIARYNEDGSLDSAFGENGWVLTDLNNSPDFVEAGIVDNDKIIVVGHTISSFSSSKRVAIARYKSNGQLDSSFNKIGFVIEETAPFYDIHPTDLAIQGDKIVVTGFVNFLDSLFLNRDGFALLRYTSDGVLDETFNADGIIITDFALNSDIPESLVIHVDKILVAGMGSTFTDIDYAVVRYTSDGNLDSSFNEDGILTAFFPSSDTYFTTSVVTGNKILAAGYVTKGFTSSFVVARFDIDGSLDSSFGKDGLVVVDFGAVNAIAEVIMAQNDKITVAGSAQIFASLDFAIARLNADGSFDSSFSEDGKQTTDIYGYDDRISSAAIHDDKIIVVGSGLNFFPFGEQPIIARYNANGALDSTLDDDGIVIADFEGAESKLQSVVIQGEKMVIAATVRPPFSTGNFAVARYSSIGTLDSSFSDDGRAYADFFGDELVAAAILHEDKIVLVGTTIDFSGNGQFAVARFTSSGLLDSTFNEDGLVATDAGLSEEAQSVALYKNKIIVGGTNMNDERILKRFAILRYSENGILDSSFGDNGITITGASTGSYSLREVVTHENRLFGVGSIEVNGVITYGAIAAYQLEAVATLSCPDDIIVAAVKGSCSVVVDNIDPNTSAMVRYTLEGATTGHGLGSVSGHSFKVGVTTVTYRLVDDTTKKCSFTVTVEALAEVCNGIDDDCDGSVDEGCPKITVSIHNATVRESEGFARIAVRLSGPPTKDWVWVYFTFKDKTAIKSKDYLGITYPLLFIPGFNKSAAIYVPIIQDNKIEGMEHFEIHLINPVNVTIKDEIGLVKIIDDDKPNGNGHDLGSSLNIQVSPNPSWNMFTVKIHGGDIKRSIILRSYDIAGRLIEIRNNVRFGESIQLGHDYRPGSYIIEAEQGNERVRTKVIKAGR